MEGFWETLFGNKMPPHGHCYLWNDQLVALHVASDALITLSYFTIPIALVYLVKKRDDLSFNYMFILFGIFIFACGLTHLVNIYNVWYGAYWLSGGIKLITAAASVGTAILVWPLIPKALALPSNETLRQINTKLRAESERNIQQRKELEHLSDQLQASVDERMAEIDELNRVKAELEEKNLQLEQSNDALQQFTYIASHDLKEPLRTISSMSQLLRHNLADRLDEQEGQMIDFISSSASRMTALIDDLRSYTVVGSQNEQFSQTDLDELVDNILGDLSARISDNRTRVSKEPLGVQTVIAPQFQQLMYNLISNATKFSAGGENPEVSIGALEGLEDGQYGLYVRDNGVGIDPADREKIFRVFERLHSKDEFEGSGIGLAICKKIVDRHAGRVEVHGAPGEGTEFRLIFPKRNR
ncbi:ATP-binding protein [Spongiibacter taiwanensis]|uniref:sensor histidine kinase n=1 Tax=Spongiibacter taiwanensis TaxID=1748242 RepID=UPI0020355D61|nr:ATP-binding protein [Spongiibacter taiwanensis]USA44437.1 ATP-binding protein [Spongiibacter taiwanensis]